MRKQPVGTALRFGAGSTMRKQPVGTALRFAEGHCAGLFRRIIITSSVKLCMLYIAG